MNKWIENNWNKTFALVPSSHPITELFVKGIHNRDYAGVDVTLTKLRCRYWTPKLKKYRIRRVKSKCMTCRKKNHRISANGSNSRHQTQASTTILLMCCGLIWITCYQIYCKEKDSWKRIWSTCQLFSV